MKLDRTYQLELLQMLAESYPQAHDIRQLLHDMDAEASGRYAANMVYLDEHGLVEASIQFGIGGHMSNGLPRITHRGMDFLADDGGLSAVLGVVTIKLHGDTIKDLIAAKIQASTLAPPDKKKWLDQLRALPAEATKHLVMKLLDKGLDLTTPAALALLGTLIHHAPV